MGKFLKEKKVCWKAHQSFLSFFFCLITAKHLMVALVSFWQVVILLSGKYAGKKAVIVKNFDDGYVLRLPTTCSLFFLCYVSPLLFNCLVSSCGLVFVVPLVVVVATSSSAHFFVPSFPLLVPWSFMFSPFLLCMVLSL